MHNNSSNQSMHLIPALKTLPAIALATLVAACGSAPQGQGAPMPPPTQGTVVPQAIPTLQTHDWDLAAAFDGRGQPVDSWRVGGQQPLRLHFDGRQVGVRNLCNNVGAGYTADGNRLQVSRPMSTMRACADRALMQLEQRVAAQLPQAQRYELRGGATPRLVLHFADGSRWELAGSATPATRYGSAGERLFLEVAPERVACNHPLMPNAQCLRVRDVRFADNGVRQSVGDWRIFQGEIDGYQHERGIRNVLRVQRYPLARPGQPQPADAPSHAYVLDMVVESERTR